MKRGYVLKEIGRRFSKDSEVECYFSKADGSYYDPLILKTNKEGYFAVTYRIPSDKPLGKYNWYSEDLKTSKKSKKSYFWVK